MEWFFESIGTAIISLIVSFLLGGVVGGTVMYKIAIKNKKIIKQKQKASDNANQTQVGGNYNEK